MINKNREQDFKIIDLIFYHLIVSPLPSMHLRKDSYFFDGDFVI